VARCRTRDRVRWLRTGRGREGRGRGHVVGSRGASRRGSVCVVRLRRSTSPGACEVCADTLFATRLGNRCSDHHAGTGSEPCPAVDPRAGGPLLDFGQAETVRARGLSVGLACPAAADPADLPTACASHIVGAGPTPNQERRSGADGKAGTSRPLAPSSRASRGFGDLCRGQHGSCRRCLIHGFGGT